MKEVQADAMPHRRSRREVEQLVAEYDASGLGRSAFCREHGLALSTLTRYQRRREREREQPSRFDANPLLAVELRDPPQAAVANAGSTLAVVLSNGRRIEVGRGFDVSTLEQLVGVLEQV